MEFDIALNEGAAIAVKMPSTEITTSNSIKVKPAARLQAAR